MCVLVVLVSELEFVAETFITRNEESCTFVISKDWRKPQVESDREEDEEREQSPEEHEALEKSLEKVIVVDLPAHTARPQRKSRLPSKYR